MSINLLLSKSKFEQGIKISPENFVFIKMGDWEDIPEELLYEEPEAPEEPQTLGQTSLLVNPLDRSQVYYWINERLYDPVTGLRITGTELEEEENISLYDFLAVATVAISNIFSLAPTSELIYLWGAEDQAIISEQDNKLKVISGRDNFVPLGYKKIIYPEYLKLFKTIQNKRKIEKLESKPLKEISFMLMAKFYSIIQDQLPFRLYEEAIPILSVATLFGRTYQTGFEFKLDLRQFPIGNPKYTHDVKFIYLNFGRFESKVEEGFDYQVLETYLNKTSPYRLAFIEISKKEAYLTKGRYNENIGMLTAP